MYRLIGWLVSVATFPGIIVHEIAHQLFCNLFSVHVHEVSYFNPFGNPPGYVIHDTPRNFGEQFCITLGPFLVNSALCITVGLVAVFSHADPSIQKDVYGVLLWLAVSIGMHAFPSWGDAQSLWAFATGKGTGSLLGKMVAFPTVVLIVLGSLGSILWLDAVYAYGLAYYGPWIILEYGPGLGLQLTRLANQSAPNLASRLIRAPAGSDSTPAPQPIVAPGPTTPPESASAGPTPFPPRLWVCVDLAYGRQEPSRASRELFQMSQRDGWYFDFDGTPYMEGAWIATKWTASPTGRAWVNTSDLCPTKPDLFIKSWANPTQQPPEIRATIAFQINPTALAWIEGTPTETPSPPIPPGMGGLVVTHAYGDEMNYDIGGKLYKIPTGGAAYIYLPPGRYTFSWNTVRDRLRPFCETANGCTVEITEGKYYRQNWTLVE